MPSEPTPQSQEPELIAPDGVAQATDDGADDSVVDVQSPAKIIRIGGMVRQLLEEVRNTTLDEAARDQLRDIYENSLVELRTALSEDLAGELDRLALDFDDDTIPTEAQLRVAKAQLVGWLEGLFHGIQATLVAQQMAARQQLEGMRAQIPQGGPGASGPVGGLGSMPGGPGYI